MGADVEKKLKALDVKRMTKPGRCADGGGLYLTVTKSGSKPWNLRVMVAGKAQVIGLGSIESISLAEAREKAARLRKVAKQGADPRAERDGKIKNGPQHSLRQPARCTMSTTRLGKLQNTVSAGSTRWRPMPSR